MKWVCLLGVLCLTTGCGSLRNASDDSPPPLFSKPDQSALVKTALGDDRGIKTLKTNVTRISLGKLDFCEIIQIDRDADGKFEEFMQVFRFARRPFLTVSNMVKSQDEFSFYPSDDILVSVDRPIDRVGTQRLVVSSTRHRIFAVFERSGQTEHFEPSTQEVADQVWRQYTEYTDDPPIGK